MEMHLGPQSLLEGDLVKRQVIKIFGYHSRRALACGAKLLRSWVFNSRQVLGFSSSLSVPQWCVLNQVPQAGTTTTGFFNKKMDA